MSLWLTEQEPFQELALVELRGGEKNSKRRKLKLLFTQGGWCHLGDTELQREIGKPAKCLKPCC